MAFAPKYTHDDIRFILNNAPFMTVGDIAVELGRCRQSVSAKISQLRREGKLPPQDAKIDMRRPYLVEIIDRDGNPTYVQIKAETEFGARLVAKEYLQWDKHINRVLTI